MKYRESFPGFFHESPLYFSMASIRMDFVIRQLGT